MNQEKKEVKEDERLCPQCDNVVHKSDFNEYFGLCDECIKNCGTGH